MREITVILDKVSKVILFFENGHWIYEVDIENRCNSSAEILDWIAQIGHKIWCSNELLGNFCNLLDAALGLQKNFCGFGKDRKPKNVSKLLDERLMHKYFKDHMKEISQK